MVDDYFIFINSTYNLSIFVSGNTKSTVNLEKMSCKNCSELAHMEFQRKMCVFENCCELLLFLLNTVLNVKSFDDHLCYCGNGKCLICGMKRTFNNHEYNLYRNMFDLNFLIDCHSCLYYYVNELFK